MMVLKQSMTKYEWHVSQDFFSDVGPFLPLMKLKWLKFDREWNEWYDA
jgi:hypothetical protein